MKKVFECLVMSLFCIALVGCAWPKVFVKTSSGWVTYDRLNHKLEVVWDFTTQTPMDSAFIPARAEEVDTIAK